MRSGYSLMEALVAMFILAVAAVGLTQATQSHVDSVRGLEQRAVGQWVAENRLVELSIGQTQDQPIVPMMGREWAVKLDRAGSDDPELQRVTVAVSEKGRDSAVVRLSGFIDTQAGR